MKILSLFFFSPFIYEAWIESTYNDRTTSTFDIPKGQLSELLNKYNEYIESNPSTQILPSQKRGVKNIIQKIKSIIHLYTYEKSPSSFFSTIDIITLDELSRRLLGRTTIELDADIINFVPTEFTARNFSLLFMLHQYTVALIIQLFRNKSEGLHKWLDRISRIARLVSFLVGFIGPVLVCSSNSTHGLLPLYYTLSYAAIFILWYKLGPRIILRVLLPIILKKIIQ